MAACALIPRQAKSSAGTRFRRVVAGARRTSGESSRSPPARMPRGQPPRAAQARPVQWRPGSRAPGAPVCRIATNPDLAIDDPDRRRHRITFEADPMRNPEDGHDRSTTNHTRCGRGFGALDNPSLFRRQKVQSDLKPGRFAAEPTLTLRSAGRSPTRRARELTRIATGTPIPGFQRESAAPTPRRRLNASHYCRDLTNESRATGHPKAVGRGRHCGLASRRPGNLLLPSKSRIGAGVSRSSDSMPEARIFAGRPPTPPPPPLSCRRRHELQPSVWRNKES